MAPLSHDLSGLVLPHDSCGTHLDENGKTIDDDLERRNFCKAGQILAEVWSATVIDGFPVVAKFVEPTPAVNFPPLSDISEEWRARHLRHSQYLIQLVRCHDSSCCGPWRTNYGNMFPNRFLPPPIAYTKGVGGMFCANVGAANAKFGKLSDRFMLSAIDPKDDRFAELPFDYFCPNPKVQAALPQRTCGECSRYFPSKALCQSHKSIHSVDMLAFDRSNDMNFIDPDDDIIEYVARGRDAPAAADPGDRLPVIQPEEYLSPLFQESYDVNSDDEFEY